MADFAISVGVDSIRASINRELDKGVNTNTKIVFDSNNQIEKSPKIFN